MEHRTQQSFDGYHCFACRTNGDPYPRRPRAYFCAFRACLLCGDKEACFSFRLHMSKFQNCLRLRNIISYRNGYQVHPTYAQHEQQQQQWRCPAVVEASRSTTKQQCTAVQQPLVIQNIYSSIIQGISTTLPQQVCSNKTQRTCDRRGGTTTTVFVCGDVKIIHQFASICQNSFVI